MSTALHPDCDRVSADVRPDAADASGASDERVTHPRFVLAATILASSLAFIDGSIVNVGLPAIGRALGASGESLSWLLNGYLLPLAALMLTGGAAGDRFGRRRLLLIGIAIFGLASLACALAPSLGWLIGARVVQGVGAALLMPNSLAILGTTFTGEARGRAIGTWAAVGAGAGALGPLLGGWLIDAVGWRAMFWVNLPIAAAAMWFGARYVVDRPPAVPQKLDLAGAALATCALASLTWGLTLWSSPREGFLTGAIGVAAGMLLAAAFIAVERRRGTAAMLPLALFGSRAFVGLTGLTLLLYGALGALFVLVPYSLITLRGFSAVEAGAALLPLPVLIALGSRAMGRIAEKIGPRWPLTVGPLLVAGGFLLATGINGDASYWRTTFPALLVIAIGMAIAVAPLTTAVLGAVDADHTGVASGFNSAVARSGGLIATALLALVLAAEGTRLASLTGIAMLVCAVAAIAAGAFAFISLQDGASHS